MGVGPRHNGSHRGDLVHVSALNQYLYCPRRCWYYEFYPPEDASAAHTRGEHEHDQYRRTSDQVREQYFVAPDLGLHGQVDVIESAGSDSLRPTADCETDERVNCGEMTPPIRPVERKRGDRYYQNDEVQLAAYCLLIAEALERSVPAGELYLRGSDERHEITVTDELRQTVTDAISAIQSFDTRDPPSLVDNPNKCRGCSVRHYCLPRATTRIDADQARGSEWKEVTRDG